MRIKWTWQRTLIAAVVVTAAIAFWRERSNRLAELAQLKHVHDIKLGQTRDDVIAIMGPTPYLYVDQHETRIRYGDSWRPAIWKRPGRLLPTLRMDPTFLIFIRLDEAGRVDLVECPSEGIDLHR